MNSVYILLGSNIDKETNIPQAISMLKKMCRVKMVSSIYETVPVGLINQPNFFNVIVNIETDLKPAELKEQILNVIEMKLKRVRNDLKESPRTIDADIILFNNEIIEYDNHYIPDPDLLTCLHIAVPVAELAPELKHPETDDTMASICRKLKGAKSDCYDSQGLIWKRSDIKFLD